LISWLTRRLLRSAHFATSPNSIPAAHARAAEAGGSYRHCFSEFVDQSVTIFIIDRRELAIIRDADGARRKGVGETLPAISFLDLCRYLIKPALKAQSGFLAPPPRTVSDQEALERIGAPATFN